MKPTTYILGALLIAGALVSGASAYTAKSTMRYSLEPYAFTDSQATRTFTSADNVAISFQSALPENTKVYFTSGIHLEVTERAEVTAPSVEVSESWIPLLDLRETKRSGESTLDIIIDASGLADYYGQPASGKKMEIHLDAPKIKLVMPAGMLKAISADENCRVELHDMALSHLRAAFNNRMCIDNCKIDTFALKISGLNEYSSSHHESADDMLNRRLVSVREYEYSYLKLTDTHIGTAFISAVAPALTVTGPCYIDRLNIDARSVNRDNQFITLTNKVGFNELDWTPDNMDRVNLSINGLAAGRIVTGRAD
ncbi:MAG: hypothetical protein K2L14_02030 [Duncaniella sp.]|nr:hypothetical protein [Duncaniella sp.]